MLCSIFLRLTVVSGLLSTFISVFGGFLIKAEDFAEFWIFMYWLNPIHYALEGITTSQFNEDHTLIELTMSTATSSSSGGAGSGGVDMVTADTFIQDFYTQWSFQHRGFNIMAMFLFIIFFRYAEFIL
jgi:ABC-type multidrug transport system permease subunit